MDVQTVPYQLQWGALTWGSSVWWCFKNNFLSLIPISGTGENSSIESCFREQKNLIALQENCHVLQCSKRSHKTKQA